MCYRQLQTFSLTCSSSRNTRTGNRHRREEREGADECFVGVLNVLADLWPFPWFLSAPFSVRSASLVAYSRTSRNLHLSRRAESPTSRPRPALDKTYQRTSSLGRCDMLDLESMEARITSALCKVAVTGSKGRRSFLQRIAALGFGTFAGIAAMRRDAFAWCSLYPLASWPCGDEPEGPEEPCDTCEEGFRCQGPPGGLVCTGYTHLYQDVCGDQVGGCPHQFIYTICLDDQDEECFCAYDFSCCCFGGA